MDKNLQMFLQESLAIEGIRRPSSDGEIAASNYFLTLREIGLEEVCAVQRVYSPGMPLRAEAGMNVRVGDHVAPPGGPAIPLALGDLLRRVSQGADPWLAHCEFQTMHPFLDGNGRTGRIVWAWNMRRVIKNPFALSFLHRFYYQTLEHGDGR